MSSFDIRNASLYQLFERNRRLREVFPAGSSESVKLAELQRWQTRRLDLTYKDLKDRERYRKGVEFFLTQLYGDAVAKRHGNLANKLNLESAMVSE